MKNLTPSLRTNIYKRRHKSGRTSWVIRWKTSEGAKWKAFTAGKTKGEALKIEADLRSKLLSGWAEEDSPDSSLSVNELTQKFIESSRFQGGTLG